MNNLKQLLDNIELLRANLLELLEEKSDLQDPNIIAASQILDAAIIRYNEMLKKNKK